MRVTGKEREKATLTRREFLKLGIKIGSLAGAGAVLGGCGLPVQQALVSQLKMPEYRLPGDPKWFATTCQECGAGCGTAVKVVDGRAKKIEGLPAHPISHGKVCARGQSSLQDLYNPDRLLRPQKREGDHFAPLQEWKEAFKLLAGQMNGGIKHSGSTLWVTPPLRGTIGSLILLLAQRVGAKIWVHDFPSSLPERVATKAVTGHAGLPYYSLYEADLVVNFGSDFLAMGHSPVHDNWAYGEFRQGRERTGNLSAKKRGVLVSFCPRVSLTVANSDLWVPVRPGGEGWVALGLGNLLAQSHKGSWPDWARKISMKLVSSISGVSEENLNKLAKRVGEAQNPLMIGGFDHGACTNGIWSLWLTQSLQKLLTGEVRTFETDLMVPLPGHAGGIATDHFISTREAIEGLKSGSYGTVWFFGVNPLYVLPSRLEMKDLLGKVSSLVSFTRYMNETASLAHLVLPTQTWLEEWGDQRVDGAFGEDGKPQSLYNLQQPVVQTVHPHTRGDEPSGAVSLAEILLSAVAEGDETLRKGIPWKQMREILRQRLSQEKWEEALTRAGIWEESPRNWEPYRGHPLSPPPTLPLAAPVPKGISPWAHLRAPSFKEAQEAKFSGEGQVLLPYPSLALGDGSLANRPWMQELPDPVTTTAWTHWVEINASTAAKLGLERGDMVRLVSEAGAIEAPAFPSPGIHPEAVAVPVGQGHTSPGYERYARRGANPLSILSPQWQEESGELAWISTRVKIEKTGQRRKLAQMDRRVGRLERRILPE